MSCLDNQIFTTFYNLEEQELDGLWKKLLVSEDDGEIVIDDGFEFEGDLQYGNLNGKGSIKFPDGDMIEGEFINGVICGKGKLIKKSKYYYEGEFQNNCINGFGRKIYDNGNIEAGVFKEGIIQTGTCIYMDSADQVIELHYLNGDLAGYRCLFRDGSAVSDNDEKKTDDVLPITVKEYTNGVYTGSIVDDERSGYGIMRYTNGTVYEGNFKNDNREGFGKVEFSNGSEYIGENKDSKYNGFGKYTSENGSVYIGELKDGIMEGFGKYMCNDGRTYVGDFYHNHFKGIMITQDGKITQNVSF